MKRYQEIESEMRSYWLGEIVDQSQIVGPVYTSKDVWGNEVKKVSWNETNTAYILKDYKLRTYKAPVEFSGTQYEQHQGDVIANIIYDVAKQNVRMFGGPDFLQLPFIDKITYTCNQLGDWTWLRDDSGHILRQRVDDKGDYIYEGALIKYAIVTDKDDDEVKDGE